MSPLAGFRGSLRERFYRHFSPEPNTGCWLWTASLSVRGYAVIYPTPKKSMWAHRLSYELHKGPIPEGMEIDHLCRMHCCVNPDHLEAVTHHENMRRSKPFQSTKTHCPQGHPYSEENTRRVSGERRCLICGRKRAREYQRRKRANERAAS